MLYMDIIFDDVTTDYISDFYVISIISYFLYIGYIDNVMDLLMYQLP